MKIIELVEHFTSHITTILHLVQDQTSDIHTYKCYNYVNIFKYKKILFFIERYLCLYVFMSYGNLISVTWSVWGSFGFAIIHTVRGVQFMSWALHFAM